MRKMILGGLLLLAVITAGFASRRIQDSKQDFKPHTIVYKVTYYDESGKVLGTNMLVRRVLSDGTWRHTIVMPDGKVLTPNGKMSAPLRRQTPNTDLPEHLHYPYLVEKSVDTDTWISPELQDYLMLTTLRPDGSKESQMEAIEVTTP